MRCAVTLRTAYSGCAVTRVGPLRLPAEVVGVAQHVLAVLGGRAGRPPTGGAYPGGGRGGIVGSCGDIVGSHDGSVGGRGGVVGGCSITRARTPCNTGGWPISARGSGSGPQAPLVLMRSSGAMLSPAGLANTCPWKCRLRPEVKNGQEYEWTVEICNMDSDSDDKRTAKN
jgi:hypothetical protein